MTYFLPRSAFGMPYAAYTPLFVFVDTLRTVFVYPLLQIVVATVACVTAGSVTPGVSDGFGDDDAADAGDAIARTATNATATARHALTVL